MRILWIDTATCGCNIAVGDENSVFAYACDDRERGQSEHLLAMIDSVLAKAHLKLTDIERIAVCKGPGSFTGVRIGLAVARMFSRVLNIPCVGVSAFELTQQAIDIPEDIIYAIAIHSFRNEPFLQVFKNQSPITDAFVATENLIHQHKIEEIFMNQPLKFFNFNDINQKVVHLYQSEIFFKKILSLSSDIKDMSAYPASPLYIRPPDAQISKPSKKAFCL